MKRCAFVILIVSLLFFASCSYESDRYAALEERYASLQNEYEDFYMSVRRIYEDTLYSPETVFEYAVQDNDPHKYFYPAPSLSDVDATLRMYLDGDEPSYAARARYAYAAYRQYAADMASMLVQLDKEFSALFGD